MNFGKHHVKNLEKNRENIKKLWWIQKIKNIYILVIENSKMVLVFRLCRHIWFENIWKYS
jgi:hypothetical protein